MIKSQKQSAKPAPAYKSAKPPAKTAHHVVAEKPGSKPDPNEALKSMSMADLQTKLGSSPDGLTQAEAQKRLTQYGPNEIEEKKTNEILKFLSYFWGPIPWMIEVAVILSAVAQHWPDFGIILLLLVANAVVGFWEEHQAGNAIAALKAKLAVKARVERDGKWVDPPARELVPGDVIRLRLGDIVPADARLLEGDPIEVDQSALTGESLPATRKPGEAVFSGSIVRQGEIGALVYATGAKTYFGKTAELVQEAHTVSHFQRAVLKIGNYLIILAVALVAVIIARRDLPGRSAPDDLAVRPGADRRGDPCGDADGALGDHGGRRAPPRQEGGDRHPAVGDRGTRRRGHLCSDKTGTLTQNKLTLGDPFCVDDMPADAGHPQCRAGLARGRQGHHRPGRPRRPEGRSGPERLPGRPFPAVRPGAQAHRSHGEGRGRQGIQGRQGRAAGDPGAGGQRREVKAAVDKAVGDFAARGFRSLGVARADGDGKWQLLGVLPLFDPPRDDAKATIATARQMGVSVKMVTGDAIAIARETAKKLGMGANILDASGFGDSKRQETAARRPSRSRRRTASPRSSRSTSSTSSMSCSRRGHIVGMTGDGVNDAPALKKADCGIAVSGATDAARAAAAIVLMTPGLSVIIDAVKESRKIFQRMNSYAIYRIAETLRVLLFMTLAILVFNFYPVTAVMIVMLALLNDGAILSIAYDNVHYRNQPEAWNMRVVLGVSTVLGVVGVVAAFGLFYLADRVFHLDRAHIQTLMYLKLSVAGHLTIFLTRTRGPFWSIRPARIL